MDTQASQKVRKGGGGPTLGGTEAIACAHSPQTKKVQAPEGGRGKGAQVNKRARTKGTRGERGDEEGRSGRRA